MHNVLQILRRDFKRLVTVPAAWVIMIGLILIPPLYAWFNIYGFWNPYGNTDSIKVAVANMDEGTDNALLGKVNLGDQIEGTLKSNDQLGWEFMGKANAMEAVESGDCYAAIVIPSDFSEDLANVVTNSKHRPTLEYYVNEKASPIRRNTPTKARPWSTAPSTTPSSPPSATCSSKPSTRPTAPSAATPTPSPTKPSANSTTPSGT